MPLPSPPSAGVLLVFKSVFKAVLFSGVGVVYQSSFLNPLTARSETYRVVAKENACRLKS